MKNDLNGWTAYEEFISRIESKDEINITVKAYAYGGEKLVKATVAEIAYLTKRIEMRSDFLEERCEALGENKLL